MDIFYRPIGDSLSIIWNKESTCSTAYLTIEEEQYDVSGCLPGLNRYNYGNYLSVLGFSGKFDIVDEFEKHCEANNCFVSHVFFGTKDDFYIAYVCSLKLRISPVPIIAAKLKVNISTCSIISGSVLLPDVILPLLKS